MTQKKFAPSEDRKTKVFLSYSRKDIEFAELLKAELEKAGFQPSLDKTDIAPGEAWQSRLGKLIQEADAVVFCLSPNSAGSTICGWEVSEAEKLGKRIVPAVADPVDPSCLPEALTKLNFIFFDNQAFDQAFRQLKQALNANLQWVRQHTRLGELALEWQARNNSNAHLIFGRSLRDAEYWAANRPADADAPTPLQMQFIAASRKAASGRQRLGLVVALAVTAVSLGLFVWGVINAITANEERDKATTVANAAINAAETISIDVVNDLQSRSGVPLDAIQSVLEITERMQSKLIETGASPLTMKVSLVGTYLQLALNQESQGHADEALKFAKQATQVSDEVKQLLDGIATKTPEQLRIQNVNNTNRSESYATLGDIQKSAFEDYEAAKASYTTEIEAAGQIDDNFRDQETKASRIAVGHMNRGDAQLMLKDYPAAFASAQTAIATYTTMLRQDSLGNCGYPALKADIAPLAQRYLQAEANVLDLLGRIMNAQKKFAEGEKYLCEALQNAKAALAAKPENLALQMMANQEYKTLSFNLHNQDGAKKLRAYQLVRTFESFAKTLSDANPANALLMGDYADSVILKANYASPESAPEFFETTYKTYATVRIKQSLLNADNAVNLEKLVASYEILLENRLGATDSDSPALKTFISVMQQRYKQGASTEERQTWARTALAAIAGK
ncbi:MAG: toll/interleukin-1 receptor domain-containing protein [Alphaproteobacteria bacterium]|nr:toll/interleukin-1 receptor domain-containing protein [Alphaproteobacteria bacterium]